MFRKPYSKGLTAQRKGRLADARRWYQKALDMQDRQEDAHRGLAALDLAQVPPDLIAATQHLAAIVDPTVADLSLMVDASSRLGDLENEQRARETILSRVPDFAKTLEHRVALAEIAMAIGDPKGAQNQWRQILSQDSSLAVAWVGLGGSFVELGEVQEAHNAFAQAVRQDPLHHGGYLGLAKTATDKRSAGRFSHLAQVVTDTAGSTSPLEDIVAFPNVGDGSTVESARHSSEYRFISSKAVSKLIGLLADEVVHAADLLHARRVDPAHESAVPSLWSDTLSRFELDETPLYIVENGEVQIRLQADPAVVLISGCDGSDTRMTTALFALAAAHIKLGHAGVLAVLDDPRQLVGAALGALPGGDLLGRYRRTRRIAKLVQDPTESGKTSGVSGTLAKRWEARLTVHTSADRLALVCTQDLPAIVDAIMALEHVDTATRKVTVAGLREDEGHERLAMKRIAELLSWVTEPDLTFLDD